MGTKRHRITIDGQEYHLNKVIPADAKSEHHIIGRMNRLQYNTNDELNKVLLYDRQHQALNRFYNQAQSPHEQLKTMLEIWEPVLSDVVREELYAILSLPRWAFYKEELVKQKYRDKELFSNETSHFYKDKL